MKLTKNFKREEFDSNDGSEMPLSVLENIKVLAVQLQYLRDYTGSSVSVNSGYRSPAHNKSIGGVKSSRHTKGFASDITIKGYTPDEVYKLIQDLISKGKILQGGLGKYKTFTHYDIYFDGKNIRRW
jgi:uncharacterized protein YcbK (DUF882 family)